MTNIHAARLKINPKINKFNFSIHVSKDLVNIATIMGSEIVVKQRRISMNAVTDQKRR